MKTKYFADDAFLVLHHVNTYETKNQLVVDLIAYPNDQIINKLYMEKLRNNEFSEEAPPQFKRFVIPIVEDEEFQVRLIYL